MNTSQHTAHTATIVYGGGMREAAQRLAAVDEANFVLDHVGQINVFLVAGLLAPGGFVGADGSPDLDALRGVLSERVADLPQLRRVAAAVGRRHRWVDAATDLNHHIRLVAAVAGLDGLAKKCGQLMTVPLPRDIPLWELLVIPVVATNSTAVVLRIHHALADGMAAATIVQQLLDPIHPDVGNAQPSSAPAMQQRGCGPRYGLEQLIPAVRRIRTTLTGREASSTILLGERSQQRGVGFLEADLHALKARTRLHGATVNDAVLAAATAGYHAALDAAGESIPARLTMSVPVALPRRKPTAGNQVGVMLVRLPIVEPDRDERLRLIAAQTRVEKARARSQGTLELMRGPLGARLMDHIGRNQHLVAGFITNVPGPAGTFRLAGAPITHLWPVAVLAGNVRLGVAAISYHDRLSCSVHYDAAHVPGVPFLRAMGEELARLSTTS